MKHVVECFRIAGHLEPDVEALVNVLGAHRLVEIFPGHVHEMRRPHFAGQLQAVVVDIGDHHVPRADEATYTGGHDADGPGAGDQHVLADEVERQRTMRGIAEGVEAGGDFGGNFLRDQPEVRCRHRDVLGERAVAVHADAARVCAQMPASCAAIAAHAAGDVAFCGNPVANGIVVHAGTELDDLSDELVADDERRTNRSLRPLVPVVDVQIGAADGGLLHLHQHLVGGHARHRHVFHPDARLGGSFDKCLHVVPAAGSAQRTRLQPSMQVF